jgi:hypothetical protein
MSRFGADDDDDDDDFATIPPGCGMPQIDWRSGTIVARIQ